ncbi:MAG TPA: hypothetical protein VNZ86_09995, partial [Bacteroidia bacterium]|nr:hypothetical protein [Bacteroidia bacterium]
RWEHRIQTPAIAGLPTDRHRAGRREHNGKEDGSTITKIISSMSVVSIPYIDIGVSTWNVYYLVYLGIKSSNGRWGIATRIMKWYLCSTPWLKWINYRRIVGY